MKYLLILLLILCLGGCNQPIIFEKEFIINVKDYKEGYGKWTIISYDNENHYFYVFRLSEEDFKKLWIKGITVNLLPQREFDSKGKGQKIIEKLGIFQTRNGKIRKGETQ